MQKAPRPPKRAHANLTLDPAVARDLRAWSAASEVSQGKLATTAIRKHLAALVAGASPEARDAYVAAGGVLPG